MIFEFWLKNEKDKIDLLLPVTPKGYRITYGNSIEVIELTNIGDINMTGNRRAISVTLEGIFSVIESSYLNRKTYPASTVDDYVNLIKKWINSKDIIRLIIADENTSKINLEFFIEDITHWEDDKSSGDINYIIKLREYRAIKTPDKFGEIIVVKEIQRAVKQTPNANTYNVVSGDSLSKIARKMYGDAGKWQSIYNANKSIIGNNPNLIYTGQKLTIPEVV